MLKPTRSIAGVILSVLPLSLVCPAALAEEPVEASEEVVFTCEELEEIKAAAIQYYKEKQPERWKFLVEDLQESAVFLKEELPQYRPASIGFWQIEQDRGIKLVRLALDSISLRHGLDLAKQDGKWIVTGNFTREEFFDPEDLKGILPPE
jgi:hypothetical protein